MLNNSQNEKIFAPTLAKLGIITYLCTNKRKDDMYITNATLIDKFCKKHSDAKSALAKWVEFVETAEWKNHSDLKNDFLSADYVGNNRYVFNIKGNNYRLVVMVVFFAGTADIRFVGTHKEYDNIKNIKNI